MSRGALRAVYGLLMSLAGLGVLFAPLDWPMWLTHTTAWALILYGGVLVDPDAVREWRRMFGGILPWTTTGGDDDGGNQ